MRILLADDDCEQLRVFQILLEAAGHVVLLAGDPAEMLRQLESGPHILVMDLRFPDTRVGLAVIRRIREQGSSVPVVVLSGWPGDLYGQPEESMVQRVMVKPVGAGDLLKAIGALV